MFPVFPVGTADLGIRILFKLKTRMTDSHHVTSQSALKTYSLVPLPLCLSLPRYHFLSEKIENRKHKIKDQMKNDCFFGSGRADWRVI